MMTQMSSVHIERPSPFFRGSRTVPSLALWVLVLACLTLRICLWRYFNSSDLMTSYVPWQLYLIEHGRWHALQHPLGIYFPAYFDLAILTSYFNGHHLNLVNQVKLISFVFDILAAIVAYFLVNHLVGEFSTGLRAQLARIAAPFCILAGPTVLINGSAWGQCDIVYVTFLLLTTYAIIANRGAVAMLCFGFAIAFKLQAVFLIPFLGAMLLARRIRWFHLALLPVGWIVALLPVAFVGGHVFEFSHLFVSQGTTFPVLAINIGNPWMVLTKLRFPEHLGTLIGIALTAAVTVAISLWGSRPAFQAPVRTLMMAAFSLLVMPYIMPRMHDRYMFPAEIFLCLLSCVDLAFALPAALVLSASLISYSSYFLWYVRNGPLIPAIFSNTAALWLAFRNVRLRITEPPTAPFAGS